MRNLPEMPHETVLPRSVVWTEFICGGCGQAMSLLASVPRRKGSSEKMHAVFCTNSKCGRNNGEGRNNPHWSISL